MPANLSTTRMTARATSVTRVDQNRQYGKTRAFFFFLKSTWCQSQGLSVFRKEMSGNWKSPLVPKEVVLMLLYSFTELKPNPLLDPAKFYTKLNKKKNNNKEVPYSLKEKWNKRQT